jgi:carboxylesterase
VILPVITTATALAGATFVFRRWRASRFERDCLARRPLGPDGIIVGAHAFELHAAGDRAVLLIHGGGDTPQTLRYLAEALHARGYTVRVPLLPGHGRTLRDFAGITADALLDAVRAEYRALRERLPRLAVVGGCCGTDERHVGAICAALLG